MAAHVPFTRAVGRALYLTDRARDDRSCGVLSSSAGASHVHFVGKHDDYRGIVLIAKTSVVVPVRVAALRHGTKCNTVFSSVDEQVSDTVATVGASACRVL